MSSLPWHSLFLFPLLVLLAPWQERPPPAGYLQVVKRVVRSPLTLLQAKYVQISQPFLVGLGLQTFHQLHYPSLGILQHLNIFLVVMGPEVDRGFKV